MKRIVAGILAHVDSGKTTLSEGMLYTAGAISKLGRVDHRDAFLDTDALERERGITIFSHQAVLTTDDCEITLLDTPGHVDFSAETERVLQVLDYAILVISGSDGIQSHTETLWKLLEHYGVPTFLFINKMDLISADRDALMSELRTRLGDGCIDFSQQDEEFYENAAMTDAKLLEEYMTDGQISDNSIAEAIAVRGIFPCFFGSALKTDGVGEFLRGFGKYTRMPNYGSEFGARVFKISEDERGKRLTYMKITGGSLRVKELVAAGGAEQKVNELRIYSGAKYTAVSEVKAGGVCAVCGLTRAYAGEGLGMERGSSQQTVIEPVLTYSVRLPEGVDLHTALTVFRKLAEEDPCMRVIVNEHLQKLDVQLMGEVQMEVLKRILADRFDIQAEFEHGSIIYKETIENTVEGVGHYEPLRHYAEVHLLIEPGEPGSGVQLCTRCSEDILERNWQRLIMTHLAEKQHIGVLTGSFITDVKITLINGRAHQKHTEGGDFRQATYRAVRQGLMQAKSVLLEPWNSFTVEVPVGNTGRAMTDLQQMGAEFDAPETIGEVTYIRGSAPINTMQDYHRELTAYTRGKGRLFSSFLGYKKCINAEKVIEEIGYDCESDIENTADSVFCSHGSGYNVKWDKVHEHMHLPAYSEPKPVNAPSERRASSIAADDDELLRIFEQTYGKVERKSPRPMRTRKTEKPFKAKPLPTGPEYLLIDGYNIIFAWDELKKIAAESLDDARQLLIEYVCNYRAMRGNNVIIVFDAYKVKGVCREVEKIHGVSVVYTKEAETADAYIEKATKELCRDYRVRVATSDSLEQMIIFGHGARRVTAREFYEEVAAAQEQIRAYIKENNIRPEDVYDVIEISKKDLT